MSTTKIPYHKTGFYSNLIVDYLQEKGGISQYYQRFPNLENFKFQLEEKSKTFNHSVRQPLVEVLKEQYANIDSSEFTKENIEALKDDQSFTIVTGHQLNLFTGPLYFLYKIISTINLTERLNLEYPNQRFVPIYWMATEDHDFDEINYFNFQEKKVLWNSDQKGGVGRFSTEGLKEVSDLLKSAFGTSKKASYLSNLFEKAYTTFPTLTEATRFIANELFGEYGLVIIDADDTRLKQFLIPYCKNELLQNTSYKNVSATNQSFEKNYKVQVNPREINLFYLKDELRERIVLENGSYKVLNTELTFTEDQILQELDKHPERFSPNVLVRPLYQEVILPNLCYIGGGGELAYWLQLKSYFEESGVSFPMLLLRNSAQIITKKQRKKLNKLDISFEELFLAQRDLIDQKVIENSSLEHDFQEKIKFLKQQFAELRETAGKTDKSFLNAVSAQEKKQINGLIHLERRLLKAEKRRQKDLVQRITKLQNAILPNQKLEERQRNFSEYYLEYGKSFIPTLKKSLDPLASSFTIIEF